MKVFAFICVDEWETNTHARVEFVWNVHIQVMLKLISFSILNMHELVETWFSKFQDWQSNVYFPWPNELTICPDINGFQIPLKTSCTGHRWRKAKDFVVFCSGKICLVLFQGCCSFVLRHLCPVPIYYMNWSWMQSTEWIDLIGNPISACRLISGNNISLAWWNMFNFGEYAEIRRPPSTSLKESNFPGLILKFPDSTNCPLREKQLIFLAL